MLPAAGFRRAKAEITAWPDYAPTKLRDLPDLARRAGISTLRMKDEATRFGLGAFKALGGAYAVATLLLNETARAGVSPAATTADLKPAIRAATERVTVTCATDGNHGRAVAWGAQRFRPRCVIFIHARRQPGRTDAIARYGAEIRSVPALMTTPSANAPARPKRATGMSSPTLPGPATPRSRADIMQGYRLMADESADQWTGAPPTHVFIQGGVGGAAAAVAVQSASDSTHPALIVVEPDHAACLLASAELGRAYRDPGRTSYHDGRTCMRRTKRARLGGAGSLGGAFMAIPDDAAVATLRLLATHGIVAGESGVAGLAGCLLVTADPAARETLGLDQQVASCCSAPKARPIRSFTRNSPVLRPKRFECAGEQGRPGAPPLKPRQGASPP